MQQRIRDKKGKFTTLYEIPNKKLLNVTLDLSVIMVILLIFNSAILAQVNYLCFYLVCLPLIILSFDEYIKFEKKLARLRYTYKDIMVRQ